MVTYLVPDTDELYRVKDAKELWDALREKLKESIYYNHGAISAWDRTYDLYPDENKSLEWINDLKRLWAIQDIISILEERL